MSSSRFLQLAPPPRHVSLPLACKTLLGIAGRFGTPLLGFGMLFVLVFGLRPADEVQLALYAATVNGTVTGVGPTSTSVNDVTVWQYEFRFRAPDGQEYTGHSYITGLYFEEGDRVTIEYATSRPEAARIEGSRLSSAPSWAAVLVLGFPTVGAVLVVGSVIGGIRQLSLLRHGQLATGQILYTQPTKATVDGMNVVRYDYEFPAGDGSTYYGIARAIESHLLGDEPQEPILYSGQNPARSMLIDSVPLGYQLKVDQYGQWVSTEGWQAVAWCTLAAVGLLALLGFVLVNLTSLL